MKFYCLISMVVVLLSLAVANVFGKMPDLNSIMEGIPREPTCSECVAQGKEWCSTWQTCDEDECHEEDIVKENCEEMGRQEVAPGVLVEYQVPGKETRSFGTVHRAYYALDEYTVVDDIGLEVKDPFHKPEVYPNGEVDKTEQPLYFKSAMLTVVSPLRRGDKVRTHWWAYPKRGVPYKSRKTELATVDNTTTIELGLNFTDGVQAVIPRDFALELVTDFANGTQAVVPLSNEPLLKYHNVPSFSKLPKYAEMLTPPAPIVEINDIEL